MSARQRIYIIAVACITLLLVCLQKQLPMLPTPTSSPDAIVLFHSPPPGEINPDTDYFFVIQTLLYQLTVDPPTRTTRDIVVIVTPRTPEWQRKVITKTGAQVVERSVPPHKYKVVHERWTEAMTKIHALGLTQYRRVLFLDSDVLLLQSPDVMLDSNKVTCHGIGPIFGAVPDPGHGGVPRPWDKSLKSYKDWLLNAGMFIACPDEKQFQAILAHANNGPRVEEYNEQDQSVLQEYFADSRPYPWARLPIRYNAYLAADDVLEAHLNGTEDVVVLHGHWWQDVPAQQHLISKAWWRVRGRMEGYTLHS